MGHAALTLMSEAPTFIVSLVVSSVLRPRCTGERCQGGEGGDAFAAEGPGSSRPLILVVEAAAEPDAGRICIGVVEGLPRGDEAVLWSDRADGLA